MPATLFNSYLPIDRYDKAALCSQFSTLAAAAQGQFAEQSLNWYFSGSTAIVHDFFWRGFPACLWIEHDWTVHTSLALTLSTQHSYELRFNNIYGEASGVPIVGPTRIESDLLPQSLTKILPEAAYWRLALARQPFALSMSKQRLALATYHFYPYQFYLDALDYLSEIATRLETMAKSPQPVRPSIERIHPPWVDK